MPLPRRLGLALACAALLTASSLGSALAAPTNDQAPAAQESKDAKGADKSGAAAGKSEAAAHQAEKRPSKQERAEQKRGEAVADRALQYVGSPYAWGGSSPAGFDCSGFIMYIYGTFGLELGHDLAAQLAGGREIDQDQLLPGDLVMFENTYKPGISHGGIYTGHGQFVHAVDESTGVVVSSTSSSYWAPRFYGASRPGAR